MENIYLKYFRPLLAVLSVMLIFSIGLNLVMENFLLNENDINDFNFTRQLLYFLVLISLSVLSFYVMKTINDRQSLKSMQLGSLWMGVISTSIILVVDTAFTLIILINSIIIILLNDYISKTKFQNSKDINIEEDSILYSIDKIRKHHIFRSLFATLSISIGGLLLGTLLSTMHLTQYSLDNFIVFGEPSKGSLIILMVITAITSTPTILLTYFLRDMIKDKHKVIAMIFIGLLVLIAGTGNVYIFIAYKRPILLFITNGILVIILSKVMFNFKWKSTLQKLDILKKKLVA